MKWSIEYFVLRLVELILVVFFCISIYNLVQLKEYNHQDQLLKISTNIGIEIILIFIGFFAFKIWYTGKITKLQKQFCLHISPFLILTGITTMVITIKRLNNINNTHKSV